jgi:hypothetical protein
MEIRDVALSPRRSVRDARARRREEWKGWGRMEDGKMKQGES